MLAHSKATQNNQWTRHVLKSHHSATPEFHNHTMRNAFISVKQKKSLEDLFQMLDDSIAGKPMVSKRTTVKTVGWKEQGKPMISKRRTVKTKEAEVKEPESEQQVSPSTRIPRLHRKRPSLEIPTDLAPSSLKRRRAKAEPRSQSSSPQSAQTLQKGDKVKIVQGAKKKFLGRTGQVEKFLFQKRKWGILLGDGSRIALGPECLKVLETKALSPLALNLPAAPLRRAQTSAQGYLGKGEEPEQAPELKLMRVRSSIEPLASRGSLSSHEPSLMPRGSTSLALPIIPDLDSIIPATQEEITQFVESFPKECRPKNAIQIMIAACVTGRKNIVVSLIVNSKIDVNVNFATAGLLHVTIANDQPEVCLLLMEMGIEVDHQDSKGCTPLILAAERGMRSVVAALCVSGANVNQPNNRNQTPLMVAAMHGHLEIVDILLENEADVKLQDEMSQNALTMAMCAEDAPHRQVVDRLIQRMYEIHSKGASAGIKKQ